MAYSSWSLLVSSDKKPYNGGAHGYDNQDKDMHAIFYAYGPVFKNKHSHSTINNIDIYPLICKILNLKSAQVDGKIENTIKMLK